MLRAHAARLIIQEGMVLSELTSLHVLCVLKISHLPAEDAANGLMLRDLPARKLRIVSWSEDHFIWHLGFAWRAPHVIRRAQCGGCLLQAMSRMHARGMGLRGRKPLKTDVVRMRINLR